MILTRSRGAFGSLCALAVVTGCSAGPVGRVSDSWVMAGGTGSGIWVAGAPSDGAPLSPKTPASATECIANEVIKQQFDDCSAHESEGSLAAKSPDGGLMDGDVPLGPTPTPGQVCWYTRDNLTVRIVLSRCGTENTFKVTQIAVAAPRKP